ncbi:methyltransferase domain-containing protein [Chlorobium sp. N1]|uniref:methyltransferase domain-containing protein n=1 Tax=Chlorobium sp. N1 TaxID=2491138 RepID=UPI001A9444DA|nr:methyltransferase domain-containing protein [Chlorobium sp. N1]
MSTYLELKRKIAKHLMRSSIGLPKTKDLSALYRKYEANSLEAESSATLDIGCGNAPRNPFGAAELFGIDVFENSEKGIRKADLAIEPIPFANDTFDFLTAYDFLEHVPRVVYLPERRLPFVELMNEIWRVLKPKGIFFSCTPAYPFPPVFQDPTHVNFLTEETFPLYFDDQHRWGAMYGFTGSFRILEQYINGQSLISVLQKA